MVAVAPWVPVLALLLVPLVLFIRRQLRAGPGAGQPVTVEAVPPVNPS